MRYCTLDDLMLAIPVRTLAQLSNDTPPATEPNLPVVERAVAHAEEVIDGYLRSRYPLPLAEVPTVVRELTVNLARHWLYARRPEGKDDLPPAVVRAYTAAIDMLKSIQKGALTIGVQATQSAQPEPGRMRVNAPSRQFGPKVLDRY
jgi:phage gp36-like protein